jgi:ribosome-binding protein aMBF1 (putative translation factor)
MIMSTFISGAITSAHRTLPVLPAHLVPLQSHDNVSKRFGRRLRTLRRDRGWTQLRMADHFGIDRSYISDVEHGKKSMSLPMLEVVALGMKISISELLREL